MKAAAAPLYEGLLAYLDRGLTGFHTPGHGGGRVLDLARLDLTELNLWPGGPSTPDLVGQAEELAAELFGAARTFFLTGGASLGVLSMVSGTCAPGSGLVIGRDCHLSVANACVLGDLRPSFLVPVSVPEWSFPLGVDPASLGEALATGGPVLVTNPTYQGVVWEHRAAGPVPGTLLVDEAHGAHLAFGPERAGSAVMGAAAWVHGTHKTLGSLTQTGMLHLGTGTPEEPVRGWLQRLSSSSPSYPLLASLDVARSWAAQHGREAWQAGTCRLSRVRERLSGAGVRVLAEADLPRSARIDPAKLTVAAPGGGYAAARRLQAEHGLQAEASGLDWLTFLVTPFHGDHEVDALVSALGRVLGGDTRRGPRTYWPAGLPLRAVWPRSAALGLRSAVPLAASAGRAAAEALCPYPPGIPLIWPGEIIERETVEYIAAVLAAGGVVSGVNRAGEVAVVA